jgi:hypothetical protein
MKFLYFSNEITDVGVEEVSKNLTNLENINTVALNFQGSATTDVGVTALAEFIKSSAKINSLALIFSALNTKISDKGAKEVIAAIHQLIYLEYLTIDFSE